MAIFQGEMHPIKTRAITRPMSVPENYQTYVTCFRRTFNVPRCDQAVHRSIPLSQHDQKLQIIKVVYIVLSHNSLTMLGHTLTKVFFDLSTWDTLLHVHSHHDIKVGKGSRDFASTTARKVVQIASIMHH